MSLYCCDAKSSIINIKIARYLQVFLKFFELFICAFLQVYSYRVGMLVSSGRVYLASRGGVEEYYVCPRCNSSLENDFAAFCDRCGQKLDWTECDKVEWVIHVD